MSGLPLVAIKTLVDSRIPSIIAEGDALVAKAVTVTANNVVYRAAKSSRVRTGNMRGGWQQQAIDRHTRRVFNDVHYTIYNEYGTIYMSAQPMLGPAIELETPLFHNRVRLAYR